MTITTPRARHLLPLLFAACGAQPKLADGPSFRDVVRSPDAWQQMQREHEAILARRELAKKWPDDLIDAAVEQFVFGLEHSDDDEDDLAGKLYIRRDRAARATVQLLARCGNCAELYVQRSARTTSMSLQESPAQRACELIANAPPAEVPNALLPMLTHGQPGIRKEAALAVASIGSAPAARAIAPVLADEDSFVRSYVITGINRAIDSERLTDEARDVLFTPLLESIGNHGCSRAADLLTTWDARRAHDSFAARGLLRAGAAGFAEALDALTRSGTLLPRSQLLELCTGEWPAGSEDEHGAALKMLARHRNEQDRALFRRAMQASNDLAEHAANALLASSGLEVWYRKLEARRGKWTKTERRLDAMSWVEIEVCNGGFSQYWWNSAGSGWKHALAGFHEVGDSHRADALTAAVEVFPTPPSTFRWRRQQQLAAVSAEADPFDPIDRRYYGDRTPIDVTLARFILAHTDELRATWNVD